jgi:hypothetical protein
MSSFDWKPNPETLALGIELVKKFHQTRREEILKDHQDSGYSWPVLIYNEIRTEKLSEGYAEWIEEHNGIESFDMWTNTNFVSFKTSDDALLFKLTFGGK